MSGANMCSCSACALMNSTVYFHIIIQTLSLSHSHSLFPLNSCLDPPPPTHPSSALHKGLLSHHCGSWCCRELGLGGRVGKTLQTRHEQMPGTLDCRVDHQGRVGCRVLMCARVNVCLICVCDRVCMGVWGSSSPDLLSPDCSSDYSAFSACLKGMETGVGGVWLHEKDLAALDMHACMICI